MTPRIPAKAWDAPVLGALDEAGRAAVEAACVLHRFSEGAHVARAGDPTDTLFVVVSGRVKTKRPRAASASFGEGDVLGVEAVTTSAFRDDDLVASEGAVVGLVPRTVLRRALARSGAGHLLGRTSFDPDVRVARDVADARRVARSLLVLDPAACVSCGHCSRACASTHGGTSRLVRRGERIEVPGIPVVLAIESCHHCTTPACLSACPTGAITREPDGRVRIRESLCTGCEACTKACGWGSVQMSVCGAASVAAKCDLCDGRASPACVEACPTEALTRVDPATAFAEEGRTTSRPTLGGDVVTRVRLGRRRPVWPVVAGAVLAASALRIAPVGRAASGMVLLASFVVVVALGVLRRIPRLTSVRGRSLYAAHLVSGAVAGIALLAHAQSASSFAGVVGATIASGALAALAYAAVPRRLARSSHGPVLLEEAESQLARTEERAFSLLSGRSDPAKALYAAVVRPYVRAPFGGVLTILAGRSPEAEARRLRARARALVGDRTHVLEHLDELLDVAVAARGCKAAIVATRLLRSVVLVHVVIAAIAVVLASMHVARVLGGSS